MARSDVIHHIQAETEEECVKKIQEIHSLNYQIVEYISNEIQPDCDIWQMIETTFFSMEKNRKKNFPPEP